MTTDPIETWHEIPGHPDYEASSLGRVRSYKHGRTPRIMNGSRHEFGYLRVVLDGRRWNVHQVVALVFHGPCPEGMQVRHLDGDATNNVPENLRYGTPLENAQDRDLHGRTARIGKPPVTHCPKGHPYDEENTYRHRHYVDCRTCKRERTRAHRARRTAASDV